MRTTLACLLFIMLSLPAYSQEKKEEGKISVSPLTAQIMVSTNFEAVCLNLVGTGIRYTRNNFIISVTIFPTLVFKEDNNPDPGEPRKPLVRPGFALGPMFQYKRFMVGFPSFYQDDTWHLTAGVGVKIGK